MVGNMFHDMYFCNEEFKSIFVCQQESCVLVTHPGVMPVVRSLPMIMFMLKESQQFWLNLGVVRVGIVTQGQNHYIT